SGASWLSTGASGVSIGASSVGASTPPPDGASATLASTVTGASTGTLASGNGASTDEVVDEPQAASHTNTRPTRIWRITGIIRPCARPVSDQVPANHSYPWSSQ